jgi:hypothetical protein
VGRFTPSASVLVAMVPPVLITDSRGMRRSCLTRAGLRARG